MPRAAACPVRTSSTLGTSAERTGKTAFNEPSRSAPTAPPAPGPPGQGAGIPADPGRGLRRGERDPGRCGRDEAALALSLSPVRVVRADALRGPRIRSDRGPHSVYARLALATLLRDRRTPGWSWAEWKNTSLSMPRQAAYVPVPVVDRRCTGLVDVVHDTINSSCWKVIRGHLVADPYGRSGSRHRHRRPAPLDVGTAGQVGSRRDPDGPAGYAKAGMPVMARPMMRVWTSSVPS